jgi:hypothetical protein
VPSIPLKLPDYRRLRLRIQFDLKFEPCEIT